MADPDRRQPQGRPEPGRSSTSPSRRANRFRPATEGLEPRRLLSTTINEFGGGSGQVGGPSGIAAGPDDALWFTEPQAGRIGRISTAGALSVFSAGITAGSGPNSIVEGPPVGGTQNLDFTETQANQIGQITTAGVVTEYPIPIDFGAPEGITLGTDGNLWFTENLTAVAALSSQTPTIASLSPSGTLIDAYPLPSNYANARLGQIAEGPDGAFWFTVSTSTGGAIGRVTTSGQFSFDTIPDGNGGAYLSRPIGIASGPTGSGVLWFTDPGNHAVGEVTTAGAITEFTAGLTSSDAPNSIAADSSGNFWFTDPNPSADSVGQITAQGVIALFPTPTASSRPAGIALGPDKNLWFAESAADQIGQVVLPSSIQDALGNQDASPIATIPSTFVVATFSDRSAATVPANFNATIAYGDGTTGPGTIQLDPNNPGGFEVVGSHVYAAVATYTATVAIGTGVGVGVGTTVLATVNATSPILLQGQPVDGIVGRRTNTLVATFTNLNFTETAAALTATILWADGTSSAGVVERFTSTAGGPQFAVYAGHVFSTAGPSVNRVTVTDTAHSIAATVASTATIAAAPIRSAANELGPASNATGSRLPTPGAGATTIVGGPDHALWFTEDQGNRIGRIDTSGTVTEYPLPLVNSLNTQPDGITSGPGGDLWFTESASSTIASVTTGGSLAFYPIKDSMGVVQEGLEPGSIAEGPDGNLWFTEFGVDAIGMFNPTTQAFAQYPLPANFLPYAITERVDNLGNGVDLWFVGLGSTMIGQVVFGQGGGTLALHPGLSGPGSGSGARSIAQGPDGNLWFTQINATDIGTINPTSFRTAEYPVPAGVAPIDVASGPDGNLYFTAVGAAPEVDQITTTGSVTRLLTGLTLHSDPRGLALGPDHNLYFTEVAGDRIGQVVLPASLAVATGRPASVFASISSSFLIATFTDLSTAVSAGNFTAAIDFGDGTKPVLAQVQPYPGMPGEFEVVATHAYQAVTTYTVHVTIGTISGGAPIAVTALVTANSPISVTGVSADGLTGRPSNSDVGFLLDRNMVDTAADFVATITWADGTTSAAVLRPVPSISSVAHQFEIYAAHAFAASGTFANSATVVNMLNGIVATGTFPTIIAPAPSFTPVNEVGPSSYSLGAGATGIALGLDAADWFTETTLGIIGRVDSSGQVTEYPLPDPNSQPTGIALGADGNLWFTEKATAKIGRITPKGVIAEFSDGIPAGANPTAIALGADGNLWFTETTQDANDPVAIGRITPGGVVTQFVQGLSGYAPFSITAGPDGALYFCDGGNNIGRITTQGAVTIIPVTPDATGVTSVAAGADGNIWFTQEYDRAIGKLDLATLKTTLYTDPSISEPGNLVAGPDGALDFVNTFPSPNTTISSEPEKITTSGVITPFPNTVALETRIGQLAPGPDGNVYFVETVGDRIGQIVLPQTSLTSLGGPEITPTQGRPFVGTVATFTEASPIATAANFDAVIDWGDGTAPDLVATTESNGVFRVPGSHTYAAFGPYAVTVTVFNAAGFRSTQILAYSGAAIVGTGLPIAAVAQRTFTQAVASFTDAGSPRPPGSYLLTINWGDGTSSPGTLGVGPGGQLEVIGTHAYAAPGGYGVSTTIQVVGNPDLIGGSLSSATVSAAPPLTFVVTNTDDSGPGSLRQVILNADSVGGHAITFAIPSPGVDTIVPLSPLPTVAGPTVIDGSSQAGFIGASPSHPLIQVDGQFAGPGGVAGLAFGPDAVGSLLFSVAVFGFSGPQVIVGAADVSLLGNVLGLLADGSVPPDPGGAAPAASFASAGVEVVAPGAVIGGTAPDLGNLISGNSGYGILVSGMQTTLTQIVGNLIGVDPTGAVARPNLLDGIALVGGANHEIVGPSNLISGNLGNGIEILGGSGDLIAGNAIGTNLARSLPIGNGDYGIDVDQGAGAILIGGPGGSSSNVISGNSAVGVGIRGGSTNVLVESNEIGTDGAGEGAVGNGIAGVLIEDSPGNVIGPGNVVSGNGVNLPGAGIWVDGPASTFNLITGNKVGTDATGNRAIPNSLIGILINQGSGNEVGGGSSGSGNLVSGNASVGVMIADPLATRNLIAGNLIGTNASGSAGLGNGSSTQGAGVYVDNAPGNVIGGPVGLGNLISGNPYDGVQVFGPGSTGTLIEGNGVGVDLAGTGRLGNGQDGLLINGAPGTRIIGNLVAANGLDGITVSGSGASNTLIQGNTIGRGIGGQPLGNGTFGVLVINGAPMPTLAGNVNVNNGDGPIRDTGLAAPAPGSNASTRSAKVTVAHGHAKPTGPAARPKAKKGRG